MIGIFGGTFDPVHYGHLRAALEVKEIFGLDEVRLVLSAKPPHRPSPNTSVANRLEMLQLAILNEPGFIVDTREIVRSGNSYMVITLESFRKEFPVQPILLFVGDDAFNKLNTWYQWQRLFEFAHIVVLTRPGYTKCRFDEFFIDKITDQPIDLKSQIAGKLYFQTITPLDISATAIRSIIAAGKNPRFLLPDPVLTYINKLQLYANSRALKQE